MAQQSLISPNPVVSRVFDEVRRSTSADDRMTLGGTVGKTALLLGILMATALLGWQAGATASGGLILIGVLVGFGVAMAATFKPKLAPVLAPIYAIVEGFVLGVISRSYETAYSGVVPQAIGLTVAIFVALLFLYAARIIKPSENFKLGVAAATGGIMLFYLASLVLGLFNVDMPLIHSSGTFGILFSLFVVALASANLVVDFDFIEDGVTNGLPKYMEWAGALGLLVTLVWLYLELLRLLSKLQSR